MRPPERLSVSEAAEKYVRLNNPGAYIGPYLNSTAWYMVEPANTLAARDKKAVVFVGPAQSGKPIALDTPIATPDGWRHFGDIHPGDLVFAADGTPTRVAIETAVFTGRPCYRITFDDGSTIVCDEVHPWSVNDMWAADPYTLVERTTLELLSTYVVKTKSGKQRFRYSIPNAQPLHLPDLQLPIDPYVLGVWLGDGDAALGYLNLNLKDAQGIISQIQARGHVCEVMPSAGNRRGTVVRVKVHGLIQSLRQAGICGRKAIPGDYLRSSVDHRRELLRGVMDTDGTVTQNGCAQVSVSDEPLAVSLYELAVTLGYKPMQDSHIPAYRYRGELREGRRSFRIRFYPVSGEDAFTLPRHIDRIRRHSEAVVKRPTHSGRRFIRAIEPVDSVSVKCIGVEHPQRRAHRFRRVAEIAAETEIDL